MKAKPDLSVLKAEPKDPSAFLDGAPTENRRPAHVPVPPVFNQRMAREQKIFRLPVDVIQALKTEAYQRSMATGQRVTETDLVDAALRLFLKLR